MEYSYELGEVVNLDIDINWYMYLSVIISAIYSMIDFYMNIYLVLLHLKKIVFLQYILR